MASRPGAVFIDSNILFYAAYFHKENIFEWISALYETVYVHQEVLNELLDGTVRTLVQELLDSGSWMLFNPENADCLSDEEYEIYLQYLDDVQQGFRNLDHKKRSMGRRIKGTKDIGEMHIIAAALITSSNLICSNDYDIEEVISDEEFKISFGGDEEQESELIIQDTLEDFCYYVVLNGIAIRKNSRNFFKMACHTDSEKRKKAKLDGLDRRLDNIPKRD